MNEEAREVVANLNRSLAEQPASTAALLEQSARPASPVVPPAAMSLGPEQVTDQAREERAEVRGHKKREKRARAESTPKTPPPKKRKTVPPELEERQKKAAARLLEMGVPALQVRTYFLLLRTRNLFNYLLFPCLIFFSYTVYLHSHSFNINFQEEALRGKRPCPVCRQLRTASDKTPDGQIHRVLGPSNEIWCPYADDKSILDKFENEQKERTQAAWRRANIEETANKAGMIDEKAWQCLTFLIIYYTF